MRRMRGVGLVLVDERGRGVDRTACRRPCPSRHRRRAPAMWRGVSTIKWCGPVAVVQRIVRHQRDEDGAVAALGDEVEAGIEELAEQREPRVERRRQPSSGAVLVITILAPSSSMPLVASRTVMCRRRLHPRLAARPRAAAVAAAASVQPSLSGLAEAPPGAAAFARSASCNRVEQRRERLVGGGDLRRVTVSWFFGGNNLGMLQPGEDCRRLPSVWSTIRLEMVRTYGSKTSLGPACQGCLHQRPANMTRHGT